MRIKQLDTVCWNINFAFNYLPPTSILSVLYIIHRVLTKMQYCGLISAWVILVTIKEVKSSVNTLPPDIFSTYNVWDNSFEVCLPAALFLRNEDFSTVLGKNGKCLVIWLTWLSDYSTDGSIVLSCCFACKRNMTWGIMLSAWWLVQLSAISLACPNNLSWFSVFRERWQQSSYCVGLWAVKACK